MGSIRLRRRALLLGTSALAGCSSCPAEAPPSSGLRTDSRRPWRTLSFASSAETPEGQEAEVSAPVGPARPILVALHGRGEAGRGLSVGARGWRDDYGVDVMRAALAAPPVELDAVGGFARRDRLDAINRSLVASPFDDLTLVCPYTPIVTRAGVAGAASFARFVTDSLVPRVVRDLAIPSGLPAAIDGVSMGGRLALLVGLTSPSTFASIGALQPALSPDEADTFADLAVEARKHASFALRLVSSDDDPFLEAVRALDVALTSRAIEHTLVVTPGPHDYAWNRGPGALEMLVHHERVLRRLAAP